MVNNIKMNLRQIAFGMWDWVYIMLAGCCEHGNERTGSMQGEGFLEELSFSRFLLRGVLS